MLVVFEGELAARQTQRLTEELLRAGHFSWDLDTNGMRWSRGLFELFGLERGSVTPNYLEFEKTIHPDDRFAQSDIESLLRNSFLVERDFRIVNSSGRMRWISVHVEPVASSNSRVSRAVGLCHDITKHKLDQQLFARSAVRLKATGRLFRSTFWFAKADGAISDFPSLPEHMRFLEKLIRPQWLDLVHPDDRVACMAAWRHASDIKEPYDICHRLIQADGSHRPYWSRAVPILSPLGEIEEWCGISIDLAEARRQFSMSESCLTGSQIRAARAILNWSVERLSQESGVRPGAVRRFEETDRFIPGNASELTAIKQAMSEAGVEFTYFVGGEPGVRPKKFNARSSPA